MQAVSASFAGRPAWMRQLVKGTDRRVEVDRGEGGHEQDLAHAAAATGDHAAPPEGAAVAVDRRDPDQGGDPAPVEAAELGQLGDQGASGDRADSRGRRQQVFGSPPGGRPSDGVVEIALDPGQRLLQPQEVAVEIALQFGNPDLAAPVAFGTGHLDNSGAGGGSARPAAVPGRRPGAAAPAGCVRRTERSPGHPGHRSWQDDRSPERNPGSGAD